MDPTNDDARVHVVRSELLRGDLQVRMAHGTCAAGVESYHRALAAAAAVKDDYPATSVFDTQKLRTELQARVAACRLASSN